MVRAPAAKATFVLRALQPADAAALQRLHDDISCSGGGTDGPARRQDAQQPPAGGEQRQRQQDGSHFDQKTEKGSADLYFHYYGGLAGQVLRCFFKWHLPQQWSVFTGATACMHACMHAHAHAHAPVRPLALAAACATVPRTHARSPLPAQAA